MTNCTAYLVAFLEQRGRYDLLVRGVGIFSEAGPSVSHQLWPVVLLTENRPTYQEAQAALVRTVDDFAGGRLGVKITPFWRTVQELLRLWGRSPGHPSNGDR